LLSTTCTGGSGAVTGRTRWGGGGGIVAYACGGDCTFFLSRAEARTITSLLLPLTSAQSINYQQSHVTRQTSHVTRHTSRVTRYLERHISTLNVSPGYIGAANRALNFFTEEEQSPPYSCERVRVTHVTRQPLHDTRHTSHVTFITALHVMPNVQSP
jgi:hypothetical protein